MIKAEFTESWNQLTVYFDPENYTGQLPIDPEWDLEYRGIEFSVVNEWYDEELDRFYFGAPYRKEVSPEDMLGSYQRGWFRIDDNGVVIENCGHYSKFAVSFSDRSHIGVLVGMRVSHPDLFTNEVELHY